MFVVAMADAARADLAERHLFIRTEADNAVADRYIERVDKRIRLLDHFPERGTPRPEFGIDIRSITFERRLLILYRVEREVVHVLRILDALRDLDSDVL